MKDTYEKELGYSEEKRHFIYVLCSAWGLFPISGAPFTVKIHDKEVEVKLDKQHRIWAADFRDYIPFRKGNIFVFKRNPDNSFSLTLKRQQATSTVDT